MDTRADKRIVRRVAAGNLFLHVGGLAAAGLLVDLKLFLVWRDPQTIAAVMFRSRRGVIAIIEASVSLESVQSEGTA